MGNRGKFNKISGTLLWQLKISDINFVLCETWRESVELPLAASRAAQMIVLAPPIELRVRQTVFLHRK